MGILGAISLLVEPINLAMLLIGTVAGLFLGVMPSLFLAGFAVALSVTLFIGKVQAIVLLAAMLGPVSIGGAVPAILMGIPGEPVNAATVFDGHPMAKRGEAGRALSIASVSSSIGGVFGVIVLATAIPFAREIVFAFGPPEVFVLILVGLSTIIVASRASILKGLVAGVFGIAIALVGFSPLGGIYRFNLGSESYMLDGIPLIPLFIGLFAIAEVFRMGEQRDSGETAVADVTRRGAMTGVRDVLSNPLTLLRSSAIGTLIGVIPGIGGAVANFVSYVVAQQTSPNRGDFGKGHPVGVISSEAANNAKDGGAMLPIFAFGIPGSSATAIFLGGLTIHGFDIGPLFLVEHLDIVWVTIFALTLSNFIGCGIVLFAAPFLARLLTLPKFYLMMIVLLFSVVGAYVFRSNIFDIPQAIFWGLVGYFLVRLKYPIVPLIIGYILGQQAEESYIQSLQISDGHYGVFFSSAVSWVLWSVLGVLGVVYYMMHRRNLTQPSGE